MPKGWKKTKIDRTHTRFINMKNKNQVEIIRHYRNNKWINIWSVLIMHQETSKTFKTRSQALAFANRYMRSHPNG